MSHHQRQGYCVICDCERTFRKRRLRHGLHATLSLVSLGVWLIPWAAAFIHWRFRKPWRCEACGRRLRRAVASSAAAVDVEMAREIRNAEVKERLQRAYEAVGAAGTLR